MALDFALAHLTRVRALVDNSGWSRYLAQLGGGSSKQTTIDKLNSFAAANLAASDRKPILQATTRMKVRSAEAGRMKAAALAWLKAHRG
jgi:aminopeptidase N